MQNNFTPYAASSGSAPMELYAQRALLRLTGNRQLLSTGMVGAVRVSFQFSEDWEGLEKTAVFSNGLVTVDVPEDEWEDGTCAVPSQVLTLAGKTVMVGVYGESATQLVLPTIWCALGRVEPGAEPSGNSDSSTLSQLQQRLDAVEDGTPLYVHALSLTPTDDQNATVTLDQSFAQIVAAVQAGHTISLELDGKCLPMTRLASGNCVEFTGAPYQSEGSTCYMLCTVPAAGAATVRTIPIGSASASGNAYDITITSTNGAFTCDQDYLDIVAAYKAGCVLRLTHPQGSGNDIDNDIYYLAGFEEEPDNNSDNYEGKFYFTQAFVSDSAKRFKLDYAAGNSKHMVISLTSTNGEIQIDSVLSSQSQNPVRNSAIADALGNKVDKFTGSSSYTHRVYAANSSGNQESLVALQGTGAQTADRIILTNANGSIRIPNPANNLDAANKQYVDGAIANKYEKPNTGIPASDLASAVQTSLSNADTALQPGDTVSAVEINSYTNNPYSTVRLESDDTGYGTPATLLLTDADANNVILTGLEDPNNDADAANKAYVDTAISAAIGTIDAVLDAINGEVI